MEATSDPFQHAPEGPKGPGGLIGFLGAGTIIQSQGSVKGITTASTIWVGVSSSVSTSSAFSSKTIRTFLVQGLAFARRTPHISRKRLASTRPMEADAAGRGVECREVRRSVCI